MPPRECLSTTSDRQCLLSTVCSHWDSFRVELPQVSPGRGSRHQLLSAGPAPLLQCCSAATSASRCLSLIIHPMSRQDHALNDS